MSECFGLRVFCVTVLTNVHHTVCSATLPPDLVLPPWLLPLQPTPPLPPVTHPSHASWCVQRGVFDRVAPAVDATQCLVFEAQVCNTTVCFCVGGG